MVFKQTFLKVLDNSSATEVMCIQVYNKKKFGSLGDLILVTVKNIVINIKLKGKVKMLKKSDLVRGVVVHTKKKVNRENGISLSFDSNFCIMLNKENNLIGTRILGPVPLELLKYKFGRRLATIAPSII